MVEYNDIYLKPAKKMLDDLYEKGLLDKSKGNTTSPKEVMPK